MPIPENALLEDRYRIEGPLASGGMGTLYRAFDTNLQIAVAIKENLFDSAQAVEQFQREALMLARLRHPSLPRVLQHFSHAGRQYLVMEFIPGPDLWEQVKRQAAPFPEAQALSWMEKICRAVGYLHSQSPPIIHRDIKPQNIKAMPDGQVVLVDFGVAKEGAADSLTATGARGVTPGFSPPEQYSGGGSSPASDVYALGATLYALLTGVKPPDSVSLAIGEAEYIPPEQLNPAISPPAAAAVRSAMQPRPGDRPQSVGAWLALLQEIMPLAPAAHSLEPPGETEDPALAASRAPRLEEVDRADIPSQVEGPTCPECGQANRPKVRFCEECGAELVSDTDGTLVEKDENSSPCLQCGAANRAGVRFCEQCGAALSAASPTHGVKEDEKSPPACPQCGAMNREEVRFCEECGAPLSLP